MTFIIPLKIVSECHIPVILRLERQREEDQEFNSSLAM